MESVRIGPGVFPAGAAAGLYEGHAVKQERQVAEDCTVAFDGLPEGGSTRRRGSTGGPTVNVAVPEGPHRQLPAPTPDKIYPQHQAEALRSATRTRP